jgi:ribosome production factor 1
MAKEARSKGGKKAKVKGRSKSQGVASSSKQPRKKTDLMRKVAAGANDTGPSVGQLTSHVGNKDARARLYAQAKRQKAARQSQQRRERQHAAARAHELGEEPPTKTQPRTIEHAREADETRVLPSDPEVHADEEEDEFADELEQGPQQAVVTTSRRPSGRAFKLLAELMECLPSATFYARKSLNLREVCRQAENAGFGHVLCLHEDKSFSKGSHANGLLWIKLPHGPTARFKVSNVKLRSDIPNAGRPTAHKPELITNNFTTRLGHRVERMVSSLFPRQPHRRGRRVVTLHNQRDFIFLRHHRYMFEQRQDSKRGHALHGRGHLSEGEPEPKYQKGTQSRKRRHTPPGADKTESQSAMDSLQVRLQELGPRMTLKLLSLQKGVFDPQHGEFEWVRPADKHGPNASRKKFYL